MPPEPPERNEPAEDHQPPDHHGARVARLIAATRKVRDHLAAPGPGDPRPPILNFTEACGFGNTAVLDHLVAQLEQKTPKAMVDCSRFNTAQIPELLTQVKVQLGHRCEAYPGLQFRRLELGLAVIQAPIAFAFARAARRQLAAAAQMIFAPPTFDRWAVDGLRGFVGMFVPRFAWLGDLAVWLLQKRFPSLYDFYKWYGHRDRALGRDPITALENLNVWAYPPPAQNWAANNLVDEVLIEALLADVRSGYGRGRLSRSRHSWYNAVVLLRNADSEAGVALLQRLNGVRAFLDGAGVRAEALLVIAGSEVHINECLMDEPVDGDGN